MKNQSRRIDHTNYTIQELMGGGVRLEKEPRFGEVREMGKSL